MTDFPDRKMTIAASHEIEGRLKQIAGNIQESQASAVAANAKTNQVIESFISIYLRETGRKIENTRLVVTYFSDRIQYHCEPRNEDKP